ncbi:MAG: M56 family metallopeptidase, partial [Clostridia bacterium]|nr:M56 family metallopeptidase [Clostridia bacterium]
MTNVLTGIFEITLGMSAVIAVCALLLLAFGKKLTAKSRYLIWSLVIIRLAIPFSLQLLPPMLTLPSVPSTEVTIPVKPEVPTGTEVNKGEKLPQNNVVAPMTDVGNVSLKEPVSTEGVAENPVVPDEGYIPQGNVSVIPDTPAETGGVISGNVTVPDTEKPTVIPDKTEPAPETPAADNGVKIDVAAVLSAIWLAGAAVFALVSIISYARYTRRVLKTSSPAEEETVAIYERLCQELGVKKAPRLLVSNTTDSPAAFGYFRRYIVLPEIPLSLSSLELTLSHELTHVKRGDLLLKFLSVAARSFHWFNPLVHYAAYKCETECELSCDEAVLRGRADEVRTEYGETLVDILKFCRRRSGSLTTH